MLLIILSALLCMDEPVAPLVTCGKIIDVSTSRRTLYINPNETYNKASRTILVDSQGKGILDKKGKKVSFARVAASVKCNHLITVDVYSSHALSDTFIIADYVIIHGDLLPNP